MCDAEDICPGGDDTVNSDTDGVPDACDACPLDDPDDTDGDGTVSIGEWKDAITVELKALKTYLETVAELSTGRDPEITKQAIFRVTKDL